MNDHPNILITGGADGLGEALARAHRAQGDDVTILDIDVQRGKALAKEIGVRFVSCDLAAFDGDALEIDERAFDAIYLNAGISAFGNFAQIPWEKQRAVLEINMIGHMRLLQQLLAEDRIANEARLAFILSAAAFTPVPVTATYSASKAGLEGFALAIEPWLLHRRISISRIYPGQMQTSHLAKHYPDPNPKGAVDPALIAKRIMTGVRRRRRAIFPDAMSRAFRILTWMIPWAMPKLIYRFNRDRFKEELFS